MFMLKATRFALRKCFFSFFLPFLCTEHQQGNFATAVQKRTRVHFISIRQMQTPTIDNEDGHAATPVDVNTSSHGVTNETRDEMHDETSSECVDGLDGDDHNKRLTHAQDVSMASLPSANDESVNAMQEDQLLKASDAATTQVHENTDIPNTNSLDDTPTATSVYRDEMKIGAAHIDNDSVIRQTDMDVQQAKESISTIHKSTSVENEEEFVAIELVESTTSITSGNPTATADNPNDETNDIPSEERTALLNDASIYAIDNSSTPATTNNQIRRKLRLNPLLTPLTKLPWDKLTSAAGTCDLLFNCKYSMRQVEDEVREEKKTIQYDLFEEEELEACHEELGLHCCSMLDDSEDERGEMTTEDGAKEKVGGEECVSKEGTVETTSTATNLEEQKAKSWRGSNPTIDMMLYRQFLEE
jgi:hypothetical protein